nr:reverse transcriptase domain-containing protein [Tanacetum cinerariifolium]
PSNRRRIPNIIEPEIRTIEEIISMADRTMEELLRAPMKGDVSNDAIKLMLFPYSLEDRARIWYEKEPPNSILTWDDLVNKFVNQFFPPSKTTHLKNEISRFTQRFDETFSEAWDRFKELLRACPHHGFSDFFQNQPSTSGTLPSITIPNPKGEMKAVTTRSGLAYEGPSIPTKSSLEKVDEQNTEEILDKEHSNRSGSTAQVQPSVVPISISEPDVPRTQTNPSIPYPSRDGELTPTRMTLELADRLITRPKGIAEDVFVKVGKFHFPTDFVVVDFEADPRVPLILGRSFLRTGRALIDVYGEEITLRVNDESITFNLNQTMIYSLTYDDTSVIRVDVIDVV